MTPEELRKARRAHGLALAQRQREQWARALAEPDRSIIQMARTMRYREIAEALGVAISTVGNRLRAARRREATRKQMETS